MPLLDVVTSLLSEVRERCRAAKRALFARPMRSNRYVVLKASRGVGVGVDLAVVVHLYYLDTLPELAALLGNVIRPFDLFVTTPHENAMTLVEGTLGSLCEGLVYCRSENRGRDVGPFVRLYRDGRLGGYNVALKLHSKKSLYSDLGAYWRQSLYGSLIGTPDTVRRALELFDQESVGMVGPHDYYLSDPSFWGANEPTVRNILCSAGDVSGGDGLGFFAGTMFWFRPAALADLAALPEKLLAFEPEAGRQDGTLAHALERAFAMMVRHAGYVTTSPALGGREIHGEQTTLGNRVPVLP